MMLIRSKDRKVANAVTPNGKQAAIANAFGIPSGKAFSCKGATDYCEIICYAGKLEKVFPGVRKALMHNWQILTNASMQEMVTLLDAMILDFVKDCEKRGAEKLFRIHWDGDFFSNDYAEAWAIVIHAHPEVRFWVYTRVVDAALILMGLDNLSLYFSADRDNIDQAEFLSQMGIRIAYVNDYFEQGKTAFPKATRCPENNKAIPLITTKGSACAVCGLCVNGRKDVLFAKNKDKVMA